MQQYWEWIYTISIVAKCPRFGPGNWPYVPVVSLFAWFCNIVPESSAIAQMEVWHNQNTQYTIKFQSIYLGVVVHNRSKVGVVIPKMGVDCNNYYFVPVS